jgi:hypothetical protein
MQAGNAGGSQEHLEELYRQAMLQQEEYSAQRRGEHEAPPAVQRPETQSPNHDELLLLDEVEQHGPTDERLPPEAWSSPQPWRFANEPLARLCRAHSTVASPACARRQAAERTLPPRRAKADTQCVDVLMSASAGRVYRGLRPRIGSEAVRRTGALSPGVSPPDQVATVGGDRVHELARHGKKGKAHARRLTTSLAVPRRLRDDPAVGAPPGHAPGRVGMIAQPHRRG